MSVIALDGELPDVAADAPAPARSGRPLGWWGMVAMIATEAMVFALLLFAYFYLRSNAQQWPLGYITSPELFKSGLRTVVLIGSSIPMHIAERAVKRGDRRLFIWGMSIAWIMGGLFLAGHVLEYIDLWKEFRPSTNAYGSLFYTITGLHALHLIVGMTAVAWVLVRAFGGRYDEHDHAAVENTALYWHFVDGVWIAVFAALYLSVNWL